MLLGVGSLGKFLHVGILRMAGYKGQLPANGAYYMEILLIDHAIIRKFDKLQQNAHTDRLAILIVGAHT